MSILRIPALPLPLLVLLALCLSQAAQQPQRDLDCIKSQSGFLKDPSEMPPPDFPRNLSKVTLTLFQSGCLGECPSFRMTVRASTAEFEGWAYVRKKGRRKTKLPPGEFEDLVRVWYESRFDAMRNQYCGYTCPDGREVVMLDRQETSIELATPQFTKEVFECFIAGRDDPEPPHEYFVLKKKLLEFAKAKGWF